MAASTPDARSYQVGWICAVRTEYIVACELLDEEYPVPTLHSNDDNNIYTCGRMQNFLVVIACLPKGKYGLTSATTVAQDLRHSFPSLRFGLMVGIGGGAPTKDHDIRLGDVVVSCPTGRTGGVIHYEFGATMQNKSFSPVGHLNSPPRILLTAVQQLDTLHYRRGHNIDKAITETLKRNPRLKAQYSRPGSGLDILFKSSYLHQDYSRSCTQCCDANSDTIVARKIRYHDDSINDGSVIQVHYGLIASADRLMKDATVRDHLAESEGILCFEMEAAGLMESFPCLVIRGICDYSDTHKNDIWQGYAAATAAAYAKELLAIIPNRDSTERSTILETSNERAQASIKKKVQSSKSDVTEVLRKQQWTISCLQQMGFKNDLSVPKSFILAVNNVLSDNDITIYVPSEQPEHYPYFVAGAFMFPSTIQAVCKDITLQEIISRMTPATIYGYKRHAVRDGRKTAPWPALRYSGNPYDRVVGMAIFGLSREQKESLHRFQTELYYFDSSEIFLEVFKKANEETHKHRLRMRAAFHVWGGSPDRLIPTEKVEWDPMDMLRSDWFQKILRLSDEQDLTIEAGDDIELTKALIEFWDGHGACLPNGHLIAGFGHP